MTGGEGKDCEACLPPLMEENRDAVRVYLICRDQLIYVPLGMEGSVPVAINHLAVHEAMRLYRVKDRRDCFEKVLRLAREFMPQREDVEDAGE